jgi:hypothetical protein
VDDNLLRELTPNGTAATSGQDNYKTYRTYDAADRLITEQGPLVGGVRDTTTFAYFPDGSMAFRTDPGATAAEGGSDVARLTGYSYDGRGLGSRVTEGQLASGGGFAGGSRTTLAAPTPTTAPGRRSSRRRVRARGPGRCGDVPAELYIESAMWITAGRSSGPRGGQTLLVVGPERLTEPFVLPRTTHPMQPLRLLDDDCLD